MRAIVFSLVLTAALSTGALAAIPTPACDACDEPPVTALDHTDIGHDALIGDVPIVADMLRSLKGSASADATAPTVAAPAQPAPPAPPAQVTQIASRTDADQVVCRYTEIVGSRIKSMLCLTKRRWDQMRHDGRRFMGDED